MIIDMNIQPAHDVLGTSPEGPLKVLMSRTYRRPSEGSQGTNTKIDDLIKLMIDDFQKQQSQYYISIPAFYRKNKYSKVINGNIQGTSTGPSYETPWVPNDGTLQGRQQDVGQTYFLDSTNKHIKLTLSGYSRLCNEWQQ